MAVVCIERYSILCLGACYLSKVYNPRPLLSLFLRIGHDGTPGGKSPSLLRRQRAQLWVQYDTVALSGRRYSTPSRPTTYRTGLASFLARHRRCGHPSSRSFDILRLRSTRHSCAGPLHTAWATRRRHQDDVDARRASHSRRVNSFLGELRCRESDASDGVSELPYTSFIS